MERERIGTPNLIGDTVRWSTAAIFLAVSLTAVEVIWGDYIILQRGIEPYRRLFALAAVGIGALGLLLMRRKIRAGTCPMGIGVGMMAFATLGAVWDGTIMPVYAVTRTCWPPLLILILSGLFLYTAAHRAIWRWRPPNVVAIRIVKTYLARDPDGSAYGTLRERLYRHIFSRVRLFKQTPSARYVRILCDLIVQEEAQLDEILEGLEIKARNESGGGSPTQIAVKLAAHRKALADHICPAYLNAKRTDQLSALELWETTWHEGQRLCRLNALPSGLEELLQTAKRRILALYGGMDDLDALQDLRRALLEEAAPEEWGPLADIFMKEAEGKLASGVIWAGASAVIEQLFALNDAQAIIAYCGALVNIGESRRTFSLYRHLGYAWWDCALALEEAPTAYRLLAWQKAFQSFLAARADRPLLEMEVPDL